jgi:octaprenyl-diphosphate synthase
MASGSLVVISDSKTKPKPIKTGSRFEQDLLKAAAAIEMIHGGSLLHDDVIDEAHMRRHCPTINLRFGPREATILGDYFLARAFSLILELKNQDVLHTFVRLLSNMVKGELLEFTYHKAAEPSEEDAREVMDLKTGSLFSAACCVGGLLCGMDHASVGNLEEYGRFAGLAYQTTDDLLDIIAESEAVGKDTGNDLPQRKPTLPLVYALQKASKEALEQLYKHEGKIPAEICDLLTDRDVRKSTMDESRAATQKAINALSGFKDNAAKTALTEFAKFATERAERHRPKTKP